MFAKLKKKVEESEGSDLQKLATSIGNATASLAERAFSLGSVQSLKNPSTQSLNGSSLSLNEIDQNQKIQIDREAEWRAKFAVCENEWKAKLIVKEQEWKLLVDAQAILVQEKNKLIEKVHQLEGCLEGDQIRSDRVEEVKTEKPQKQSNEIFSLQCQVEELTKKANEDAALIQELQVKNQEASLAVSSQILKKGSSELGELRNQFGKGNEIKPELDLLNKEKEAEVRKELEEEKKKSKSLATELTIATSELEITKEELKKATDEVSNTTKERDSCLMRNAELSQQLGLCQQQLQRTEKDLAQLKSEWDQLVNAGGGEKCLQHEAAELDITIQEKNKTIKLLQQRLADMKKTLQKELKGQELGLASGLSPLVSRKSPAIFPPPLPEPQTKPSITSSDGTDSDNDWNVLEPVNFKYLKHVLFKFLTSREYEAQHLTRAVSTLLKLSPDEDKLLKETMEWKMSWFGSKPDLGSGQKALYIPPSH